MPHAGLQGSFHRRTSVPSLAPQSEREWVHAYSGAIHYEAEGLYVSSAWSEHTRAAFLLRLVKECLCRWLGGEGLRYLRW